MDVGFVKSGWRQERDIGVDDGRPEGKPRIGFERMGLVMGWRGRVALELLC